MKSIRRFPIGSMVKWMHGIDLSERFGLVVAYVDIDIGVKNERMMALQVYTDNSIEYVRPGICRTVQRPYSKIR